MQKINLLLCCLVLSQLSWASDWKVAKDKNGVLVETRKSDEDKFKSYRATTTLKGNMDEVIAFMEDVPNMTNWSHKIKAAKYINIYEPGHSHIYLVQKMPFVKNRDLSLEIVTSKLKDGQYQFLIKEDVDAAPANDKYVRIPKFRGSYIFTQKPEGKVEVVYSASVLPGGSIPAWVANAVVVDIPYNTLKNMQEQDFSSYKGKNVFPL